MIGSLFTWFFFAIISFLIFVYWKNEHSSFARTIDLIPGPPKLPLIGSIMEIKNSKKGESLLR